MSLSLVAADPGHDYEAALGWMQASIGVQAQRHGCVVLTMHRHTYAGSAALGNELDIDH
jgi:hypothetical protein